MEIAQLRVALADTAENCSRELSASELDLFCQYYELVIRWNDRLHLTTITHPLQFARRHLIESAFAVERLQQNITKIWDLGSGLGVPGIPFSVLRPDLSVVLIEANKKKAIFLKEAVDCLNLRNVSVCNVRLESLARLERFSCILVRALEEMGKMIPGILNLGIECPQILIFGGSEVRSQLLSHLDLQLKLESELLPFSENRWLYSLTRST